MIHIGIFDTTDLMLYVRSRSELQYCMTNWPTFLSRKNHRYKAHLSKGCRVDPFWAKHDLITLCTKHNSKILVIKIHSGMFVQRYLVFSISCMKMILSYHHTLLKVTYIYFIHLTTSPIEDANKDLFYATIDQIISSTKYHLNIFAQEMIHIAILQIFVCIQLYFW